MLDTSIVIHARDSNAAVLDRLFKYDGIATLSVLSLLELQRGLYKNPADTAIRQIRLSLFLEQVSVLAFDTAAAEAYGRIIAQLGWVKGRDFDRMIAAHAISTRAILVTSNEADFRDVPGLQYENWLAA
jgi:tRNA(fMet)-specific endonuclease VapC